MAFEVKLEEVNVRVEFKDNLPTLDQLKGAANRLEAFLDADVVLKHGKWYVSVEVGDDGGGE